MVRNALRTPVRTSVRTHVRTSRVRGSRARARARARARTHSYISPSSVSAPRPCVTTGGRRPSTPRSDDTRPELHHTHPAAKEAQ